jgi:hypothetical protein
VPGPPSRSSISTHLHARITLFYRGASCKQLRLTGPRLDSWQLTSTVSSYSTVVAVCCRGNIYILFYSILSLLPTEKNRNISIIHTTCFVARQSVELCMNAVRLQALHSFIIFQSTKTWNFPHKSLHCCYTLLKILTLKSLYLWNHQKKPKNCSRTEFPML